MRKAITVSERPTGGMEGEVELMGGAEVLFRITPGDDERQPWQVWLSHAISAPNTNGHPDLRPRPDMMGVVFTDLLAAYKAGLPDSFACREHEAWMDRWSKARAQ